MKAQKTIWKDILGYEGIYQISNIGEIKSLERFTVSKSNSIQLRKERLLTPNKSKRYIEYTLSKNRKSKSFLLHRLLAKTFIPNSLNLPQVNHKDCNKSNNDLSNLEWCTAKENIKHAWDNNLCEKSRTNMSKLAKRLHKNKDKRLRNYA